MRGRRVGGRPAHVPTPDYDHDHVGWLFAPYDRAQPLLAARVTAIRATGGLADGCCDPASDLGAIVNEVGDDDRGREEEQAEDEVPDEAVALSASDSGGPNAIAIQMAANKIHQMTDMVVSPFAFVQNALACYRTAASAPSTLPHRAVVRTTRASPQEG